LPSPIARAPRRSHEFARPTTIECAGNLVVVASRRARPRPRVADPSSRRPRSSRAYRASREASAIGARVSGARARRPRSAPVAIVGLFAHRKGRPDDDAVVGARAARLADARAPIAAWSRRR
jgi:hypothetical protein|tara:strand:- start:253 stop:618 length:366 start_codon:yes stop_codon:yes gene_type:complete